MHRSDLSRVLAVERMAYHYPWNEGIFRDCLRMGYSNWVVTNALDELLGYGLMSFAVDEAHILNLCVRRDSRRQGLGAFVLEHLMQQARNHGAAHVLLEVRRSNLPAIILYRQAGFEEIGQRRAYYPVPGGREDALVLARKP